MDLPETLTVPINIQKMAQNAPKIDNKNKPLLLPVLLTVAASLPAATFAFLLFNLTRLKLDILSKARLTRGLSAADAGVVGIDSTNAHSAEENLLVAPRPSLSSSPLLTSAGEPLES